MSKGASAIVSQNWSQQRWAQSALVVGLTFDREGLAAAKVDENLGEGNKSWQARGRNETLPSREGPAVSGRPKAAPDSAGFGRPDT